MRRPISRLALAAGLLLAAVAGGCSGSGEDASESARKGQGGRGHGGGPPGGGRPGPGALEGATAVPVEVVPVQRRGISSYIETNGTLEAENEVDIVARVSAPIVELLVEEGDRVEAGQVVARLDPTEFQAQLEISRVSVNETTLSYERARSLQLEQLISSESFEQARSDYETAQAQFEANRIQLGYTEIRAPFGGLVVNRYVDPAQQVSNNTALYRISDFDPLLCPIQVPERELSKLHLGQTSYLTVEAFPDEQFDASVLRISPVISAATGTIKVTLVVAARERLRPGMFARVFVETEKRDEALVIPKAALSLDSIGDTIYVVADGVASRRDVTLGFTEGDSVEVVAGVSDDELVVVVGQDGLSDGTPVQVLRAAGMPATTPGRPDRAAASVERRGGRGPANVSAEQLESIRARMRERGMTDEQIEARLAEHANAAPGSGRQAAPPGDEGGRRKGPGGRGMDPSQMTAEQLEQFKQRMRDRGMTEEQIDERLARARSRGQ